MPPPCTTPPLPSTRPLLIPTTPRSYMLATLSLTLSPPLITRPSTIHAMRPLSFATAPTPRRSLDTTTVMSMALTLTVATMSTPTSTLTTAPMATRVPECPLRSPTTPSAASSGASTTANTLSLPMSNTATLWNKNLTSPMNTPRPTTAPARRTGERSTTGLSTTTAPLITSTLVIIPPESSTSESQLWIPSKIIWLHCALLIRSLK
mmetsp:Transcript_15832/g.19928  ORF Transcript_15832/g.19928 Transcript_15832/m.19928 type:complete len:207 (-) Transcript_15832:46-666(-)